MIKLPETTEDIEQRRLAIFLDSTELLWCHVPNGGKRSKGEAGKLKAHGQKAGVPDCLIFNAPTNPDYYNACGLAIELKRKDGKLTRYQKHWLSALQRNGWIAAVCYGHRAAVELIQEAYNLRR